MLYPGQQGGEAMVSLLLGDRSPAGRLPYTWYPRGFESDRPDINDHDLRSGKGLTYRYFTGTPVFPYGHGLAYTSFEYSWATPPPASVSTTALAAAGSIEVSVHVRNTGSRPSDAVLLAFSATNGVQGCPTKSLAGFARVHVSPGGTATAQLMLGIRELACVDEAGAILLQEAELELTAGDVDAPITAKVQLTGPHITLAP